MQIVPMRDLKNTVEIERRCENGPVFVTKNGYGCLVVMDIDDYERRLALADEAAFVSRGLEDLKEDRVRDGAAALKGLRDKYGV